MILKKLLPFILLCISISLTAAEPAATSVKIYGFVSNDFYYNSRQNEQSVDGTIHLFPKSKPLTGTDTNATPQAEMLSVNSRLGFDINSGPLLGAKSTGKIEADFGGFSTTFYVFRIRQAYMKLNWDKTELLIGQTWHPLFGNVMPTGPSHNAGSPFQPFNRSPQIRLKQNLSKSLTLTGAALYQMQYTSQGPLGASNAYLKNALLPNLFVGLENKTTHWTIGTGVDVKTIKPATEVITSGSIVAYAQYSANKFQLKGKALLGENLSDQLMICGYGVSGVNDSVYTNFNNASGWLNAVYGTKWQAGLFLGISQNLGTNRNLLASGGKFTAYGWGFTQTDQQLMDCLYRIAPHISYNLPNMKLGLEYDYTAAKYGILTKTGRVSNPYTVANNRIVASISYIF